MNTIPILLYHGINSDASQRMAPFAVTPDDFVRHMDLLVDRGFRCLTVSNLIDEMAKPIKDDEKIAVVTFDDGYADFATHALPAMNARHIASTLYLTSGWLDGGTSETLVRPDDKFLHWSQIPELLNSDVEIGAHSHSHPQMDTLDSAAAVYELTRSKALIEDSISDSIRSFAYPHGYSSPRIRKLTADAGYDSATAVRNLLSSPLDDPFRLARLMLMSTTSVEDVANWLDAIDPPTETPVGKMKTVGWRSYRRGRSILTRQPGTDYA